MVFLRTRRSPGVLYRMLVVGACLLSILSLLGGVPRISSKKHPCPHSVWGLLVVMPPPNGGSRNGHVTQ